MLFLIILLSLSCNVAKTSQNPNKSQDYSFQEFRELKGVDDRYAMLSASVYSLQYETGLDDISDIIAQKTSDVTAARKTRNILLMIAPSLMALGEAARHYPPTDQQDNVQRICVTCSYMIGSCLLGGAIAGAMGVNDTEHDLDTLQEYKTFHAEVTKRYTPEQLQRYKENAGMSEAFRLDFFPDPKAKKMQ